MEQTGKGDTDVKRAMQLEVLKRDLSNLPTKRDLAWQELQNGVDPRWLVQKYGFPLETMQAAKAELDRRLAAKELARNANVPDRLAETL